MHEATPPCNNMSRQSAAFRHLWGVQTRSSRGHLIAQGVDVHGQPPGMRSGQQAPLEQAEGCAHAREGALGALWAWKLAHALLTGLNSVAGRGLGPVALGCWLQPLQRILPACLALQHGW